MALVKKETIDKVEIVNAHDTPTIQVRKKVWVEDDETGEVFGEGQYVRHVVEPDADVTNEDQLVKDLSGVVHTAEVKAAYQAKKGANGNSPL